MLFRLTDVVLDVGGAHYVFLADKLQVLFAFVAVGFGSTVHGVLGSDRARGGLAICPAKSHDADHEPLK
jgi:hypothetical protein